jgi:hypothetical protein
MTLEEVTAYAAKITKLAPYEPAIKFKELFEEMAVHTRKRKPKDILLKRRPNEPDDVFEYRIANYEPITYGSMNKAFDNLNRILTGINYNLSVSDDKVTEYLSTKKFMGVDFKMFFSKVVLKRMIEDPNGYLLWLPGGQGVDSSASTVEPYPVLMFSFNIIDWGKDFIVFLSDEKSYLTTGQGKNQVVKKEGRVYYILTTDTFYKYIEQDAGKFLLEVVYVHNLGEIPMVPLGGDLNADGYYESFFSPYIAFGNESIRQFSDFQALSTTSAHPIREVFTMECEVQRLDLDADDDNDEENKTYSRQVKVQPFTKGPFNEIQRPVGENSHDGLGQKYLDAAIPTVRFINPDIAFVQNAWKSTREMLELAEDSLHLNLGEISLSGKAKEIDLLSHEDMLNKIANQILNNMLVSARFIVAYTNNTPYDKSRVKLTKPTSFRVKTESELLDELNKLKTSNAPAWIVSAVARQLALARFSGDEVNQKIFVLITTYDPLFVYTVSEKQTMVLAGTANKDMVTKSNYLYSILLNILSEQGEAKFLEMENQALISLFESKVQIYITENQTILTDPNGNPIA